MARAGYWQPGHPSISPWVGRLALAIIGLILALAGIVLLAEVKPPRADQALPAMGRGGLR